MSLLSSPVAYGGCRLPFWDTAMGSGLKVMKVPLPFVGGVGELMAQPHGSLGFLHYVPPPPPGRASLHDKASLRLEQVRSEDQGWYECKVLMLDQQYDTFHNGSWVHLTINGAYLFLGTGQGRWPLGPTLEEMPLLRGALLSPDPIRFWFMFSLHPSDMFLEFMGH